MVNIVLYKVSHAYDQTKEGSTQYIVSQLQFSLAVLFSDICSPFRLLDHKPDLSNYMLHRFEVVIACLFDFRVRSKDYKKRALQNVQLMLAPGFDIGISV